MRLRRGEFGSKFTLFLLLVTAPYAYPVDVEDTKYVETIWLQIEGASREVALRSHETRGKKVYYLFELEGKKELRKIDKKTVKRLKTLSRSKARRRVAYIKRTGGGFQHATYSLPAIKIEGNTVSAGIAFSMRAGLKKPPENPSGSQNQTEKVIKALFPQIWEPAVVRGSEEPVFSKDAIRLFKEPQEHKRGVKYLANTKFGETPVPIRFVRYTDSNKTHALVVTRSFRAFAGHEAYYFVVPTSVIQHLTPHSQANFLKALVMNDRPPTREELLREVTPKQMNEKMASLATNGIDHRLWKFKTVYFVSDKEALTAGQELDMVSIADARWKLKNNQGDPIENLTQIKRLGGIAGVGLEAFFTDHIARISTVEGWRNVLTQFTDRSKPTSRDWWNLLSSLLKDKAFVKENLRSIGTLLEAILEFESGRAGAEVAEVKKDGILAIKRAQRKLKDSLGLRDKLRFQYLMNQVSPNKLRSFMLSCAAKLL